MGLNEIVGEKFFHGRLQSTHKMIQVSMGHFEIFKAGSILFLTQMAQMTQNVY